MLSASSGPQSALDPAGRGAEQISGLFWAMSAGALVVWLAFVGLALYALYRTPERYSAKSARLLIVGGGVFFPTLVLTALLSYGLATLPGYLAPAPAGALHISVIGEQWWWRVRYLLRNGEVVDLANEIRLPVGAQVEFQLESHDVIHSFWIPALGGKVDMIPGRQNRLRLEPTKLGVFRGVCAEYCGTSHALMSFSVVVLEQAEFARWLAQQARPAGTPADPLSARGSELFVANGCGACHAVRGTPADGVVGPDLTHVGSRRTLAAGTLSNKADTFRHWIARTNDFKPAVQMPAFGMLPPEDISALASYLEGLK